MRTTLEVRNDLVQMLEDFHDRADALFAVRLEQAHFGQRHFAVFAQASLPHAARQLVQFKAIKTMPVRDYVAATSVGIVVGVPMLDLCYEEDSRADVDMNVVMTGSGKFIELQGTAEHAPFDDSQMTDLIALARAGIARLVEIQKRAVSL